MADLDGARWLIVGLGNPGRRYERNRHNVGFMVAELLAAKEDSLSWRSSTRFSGELAVGSLGKHPVVLLKPQTYMNLSGESVGPVARFYRIPVEQLVVIHDDVDLETGRLKIKQGGGDGGHNGLRSMSQLLGDPEYLRVRVGVGRPPVIDGRVHGEVADYVLSDFRTEELDTVEETVTRAAKAVRTLLSRGLKEAMNRFNRPPKRPKPDKPDDEGLAIEVKKG